MSKQKNFKIYIFGLLCGLILSANSVFAEVSRNPCEQSNLESVVNDSSNQNLNDLRANGLVGELENGYVEARESVAQSAVEKINQERKKIYETRAQKEGIEISYVEHIYAKLILESLPSGSWIKIKGKWSQKE